MRVTFGLIHYHSPILQRLQREVLPTIAHYPDGEFEILCIDNGPQPDHVLIDFLGTLMVPTQYHWNEGRNVKVAAAKNQIYARASHPVVVYICANHGRMYDPTWLEDIVAPVQSPQVALAGHAQRYPLSHIDKGHGEGAFIQGGVLAVNVDILRRHPLPDSYPHDHSDKMICWLLMEAGYGMAHVRTIYSVWREKAPENHTYKFVHAEE